MTIINSGTIYFNGLVTPEMQEILSRDVRLCRNENVCWEESEERDWSFLEIEDVCGNLQDDLNKIVDILAKYGIKPLVGEVNRYYGDFDGYDVFTGERFESMCCEDYGSWDTSEEEMVQRLEKLGYTVIPPAETAIKG